MYDKVSVKWHVHGDWPLSNVRTTKGYVSLNSMYRDVSQSGVWTVVCRLSCMCMVLYHQALFKWSVYSDVPLR